MQYLKLVKLLFLQEATIDSLQEWLGDAAIGSNPTLRLIAGIIYIHEKDYSEALKHTHSGGTMELSGFFSILDIWSSSLVLWIMKKVALLVQDLYMIKI